MSLYMNPFYNNSNTIRCQRFGNIAEKMHQMFIGFQEINIPFVIKKNLFELRELDQKLFLN